MFLQSPGAALELVIDGMRRCLQRLITLDRLDVFVCTRATIFPSEDRPELEFRPLTRDDFMRMRQRSDRFGDHARLYFDQRGIDSAFGVFVDGELGHISWAYTAEEYQREPYERFRLGADEAEIVNCYTSEAYRGRGLYPHAVTRIAVLLLSRGFERVFMNIEIDNEASRRGILKAGLTSCGRVLHWRSPAVTKWRGWYRRQPQ
jgi:RimJ/RimL family protein N-acetyltransferase